MLKEHMIYVLKFCTTLMNKEEMQRLTGESALPVIHCSLIECGGMS